MAAPHVTRRLAAVLAADVVGYSRLVGRDEAGTIASLKAIRIQFVEPTIARHGGRVVKLMGDGALVEFPSVVSAFEAAVEIQQGMAERGLDRAEEDRIRLRIGINLGDVVVDGSDILGDGVNIAARLEGLAEPGGICVSGTVHDQLRDRLAYPLEDLGERVVKNIARPLRVHALPAAALVLLPRVPAAGPTGPAARAVRRRGLTGAAAAVMVAVVLGSAWWLALPATPPSTLAAAPLAPSAPRLSIVVLPFTNLGGDPEQEYFADGITDDLTTDLARVDGSFVIARNTAFTYKGRSVDAREVGRELGVRYILAGSVRRMGTQVRVNAQLIDAATGGEVWADRLEGDWTRSMALQDEITVRLARALDLELTDAESRRAERERPNNPDALDLTMRGWSVLNRPLAKASLDEATPLFERALRLEPELPAALVGLARALSAAASGHMTATPGDDLAKADAAVSRVLAAHPNHAMAHFVRGEILVTQRRFEAAVREYEAAIESNHGLAPAYGAIGRALIRAGRAQAAFRQLEAAIRLSPRDPLLNTWYFSICHAHSHLAEDEAAIDWCSRSVELAPYWVAFVDLASAYAWTGRAAEARAAVARLRELVPGYTVERWTHEGWSDNPVFLAQYQRIVEGLRKAGLPER